MGGIRRYVKEIDIVCLERALIISLERALIICLERALMISLKRALFEFSSLWKLTFTLQFDSMDESLCKPWLGIVNVM